MTSNSSPAATRWPTESDCFQTLPVAGDVIVSQPGGTLSVPASLTTAGSASNVSLGKLFGAKRRQALEKVESMLEAIGLHAARDKYPSQLILRLWQANRMTVFMITHDLKESFQLGTRLLVFDKRRHDPHAPERYGATVTYDIPLNRKKHALPVSALTAELARS